MPVVLSGAAPALHVGGICNPVTECGSDVSCHRVLPTRSGAASGYAPGLPSFSERSGPESLSSRRVRMARATRFAPAARAR